jgi:glycine cleavage system H protein
MDPSDRKYSQDHEWIQISGTEGRVGITDYAQKQLGDVVYIELPEVGTKVDKGQVFGSIESVKAVSELFSPMSGEVTEVNGTLASKPETVNSDPYGAWMVRLTLTAPDETADLMDAGAYGELVK